MAEFGDTVDPEDIDRFAAQGADWWDPSGSFRPLHQINPARIDFIRRELIAHFQRDARSLAPFTGLSLADIGCGGGLVAEPMTRLGCTVTGIDAGAEAIAAARDHAESTGLAIDYRVEDVEALAGAGARFDIVLALEIIEHVADRDAFFATLGMLVKPGGLFIGATLNRTARSFALAIVGAEYLLGWLPRGTHDWNRFVTTDELGRYLGDAGFGPPQLSGIIYDVMNDSWRLGSDTDVNYIAATSRLA
jgi:2-polyprenyl-6-hydroxyphenyl methylase / 3-demethylubiquinone-9 3-methyltransferase